jgi:hypothetical protein
LSAGLNLFSTGQQGLEQSGLPNDGKEKVTVKRVLQLVVALSCLIGIGIAVAADVVPNEIQQPGTQPGEVNNLEAPDKCDNCHGGYNQAVEPAFNWRGSMMANAGRDPIFWATLAIAEQDFDGAGDLCIRCHSIGGWYAGRSTPTDGSALAAGDADGVDCDACHKMTNPDNSEHLGVMNPPFIANEVDPLTGYYGSGMLSLWDGNEKLGPYTDPVARHQFVQSGFHRSVDFCGSCHDVSNPAVGDLAHNNGKQDTADPVVASGDLGSSVEEKAAFNNLPYQYGIVERTYSEFKAGLLSQTLVSDYANLPDDLKAGAIAAAFQSAAGDYVDGAPRYFSCQTCHLRAVTGQGCNKKGAPVRADLPLHDMTGGNYWMADAILYQDTQGALRLGGGLTDVQIQALQAGQARAEQQLSWAASLTIDDVNNKLLKVTNLTGHKLISGYPEGRRMWLNVKWYDGGGLLREDGKYGELTVNIDGTLTEVRTILNLADPNTKIYQAHNAMTQEWAAQLVLLGYPLDLPLSFDRDTGDVDHTLGDLDDQEPGTYHETFHFVLNNYVAKDNRIPPYGMSYDEARVRNALPVPAGQYGNPGLGGTYNYWDEITLNPPAGAEYATIDLVYQPTSWEYVQFLYLANDRTNPFLADEGANMLQAWLDNGMAEPYVMASTAWGTPPNRAPYTPTNPIPANGATAVPSTQTLLWQGGDPDGDVVTYTVAFGDSDPPSVVAPGVTSNSYDPGVLIDDTTYFWIITATDGISIAVGPAWRFNTAVAPPNQAPYMPTNPIPANGATAVPITQTLLWQGGDPDDDVVTYTVAFGDSDPPSVVATGATTNSYDPGVLIHDTTYFWIIAATDGISTAVGPTWRFTTTVAPPSQAPIPPTLLSPSNGSTITDTTPTFDWSTVADATQYQVQIDNHDSFASPERDATMSASIYTPASGLSDGAYYWRVRAHDTAGNWSDWATVWNATIDTAPPSSAVDALPATQGSISFSLSWSGSDATSGVSCYDVQHREGVGGAWTDWYTCTISATANFTGECDNTYFFRSRAQDNAGNWETYPAIPNDYDTKTAAPICPLPPQISHEVFLPAILRQ